MLFVYIEEPDDLIRLNYYECNHQFASLFRYTFAGEVWQGLQCSFGGHFSSDILSHLSDE